MATKSVKKSVTEEKTAAVAADVKKPAVKAEAAKQTEAKKTTAKKEAEPKKAVETKTAAPRKTTAKKKEITTTVYIEYLGKQVDVKDSVPEIKQLWRKAGHKIRDIKDIKFYAKPEDSKIYFVVNDEFSGSVEL